MRHFSNVNGEPTRAQLLSVNQHGTGYGFQLLHATHRQKNRCIAKNKKAAPHRHSDCYHMVLFTAGNNTFFLNRHEHPAKRGTFVITSPGEEHDFSPLQQGNIEYSEITFRFAGQKDLQGLAMTSQSLLSALIGRHLDTVNFPLGFSESQTIRLENLFEKYLQYTLEPGKLNEVLSEQVIIEIIYSLAREIYIPRESTTLAAKLLLVQEHIQTNYQSKLSVGQLADMANLSRGYLFRQFKQQVGLSPLDYQHKIKLDAAATLLRTTNLKINQIAERVGLPDVYHFSKLFKKKLGAAPSHYRKKHTQAT
ncbi:AraC family transcriptional regulator [Photobacterium satsumensis]|uniref:helix-turn-helix domain-containing protein n=1 Tax=Photobacterium satsumensis TaxID=2910239 RepID=UPI003D13559B